METKEPLLKVEDLVVSAYDINRTVGFPVDGANFKIDKGEILGLVGESGSGKTTVAYSIIRLIGNAITKTKDVQRVTSFWKHFPSESASLKTRPESKSSTISEREIVGGKIIFKGKDLLSLSDKEMNVVQGDDISMIFQDPIAFMHPMMTVGYQVGEPKKVHERLRWEKIRKIVFDYLGKVKLPDAKLRAYFDPGKFSKGEGQRIMIAMALICDPSLLLADEPTSSLDVTTQRQVMGLLKKLNNELDLSILYITHDLGVIFEMSDHVAVMYGGKIVEYGDVVTMWKNPKHPYTIGLKDAYPSLYGPIKKLKGIRGDPPTPFDKFPGCKFYPRCDYAKPTCNENKPYPIEVEPGHSVSCLRVYEI